MIQTKKRSVRPFYIVAMEREIDVADVVKELKRKMRNKTITAKEIKLIDEITTAVKSYKKKSK